MAKKPKNGRPRTKPPAPSFDRMVGARVRVRRTILKLAPAAFAKSIGKSVSQLYRYESGDVRCDAQTLVKMAKALACQPSDLIDGINAK